MILDRADLGKLGVAVGGSAEIGGRRVRVVGTTSGLRGVGAVNVIASLTTATQIEPSLRQSDDVAYLVVKLQPGADQLRVRDALNAGPSPRRFEAWTADELANRTLKFWILESGLGVGVAFSSAIALLVGVVITSQAVRIVVEADERQSYTASVKRISEIFGTPAPSDDPTARVDLRTLEMVLQIEAGALLRIGQRVRAIVTAVERPAH